jgi:hypothetical protein
MNSSRITYEHGIYILILLAAFGVRLMRLDEAPLSDFEAERALQAFQISNGENVGLSPGPAYAFLTGAAFFLFNDNNLYARIWPLIAGCCLILFAYLIRSLIGRKAALFLALGFALDPGLVAFSRSVNLDILAFGFGALALGLVYHRKMLLAGIFTGLMLLSGPSALQGLIGFGLAWLLGNTLAKLEIIDPFPHQCLDENKGTLLRTGLIGIGGVILVVGTLFFRFPEGLGALTGVVPAFFSSWVSASGIPAARLIIVLIIYHPVALIFGTIAIIRGWWRRKAILQWLSIWVGVSILLILLSPGRQVSGLAWTLISLWTLASIEIAQYFRLREAESFPALGQALLIAVLMALGWLNLAGLGTSGDKESIFLRWAVIGGTLVLGAITTVLVGLGWSRKTAQQGLTWGLLLGLGLYTIATMWGVSQLRPNGEQELTSQFPVAKNVREFQSTLENLSEWRTGFDDTLDVVATTSTPSLRWVLRNWPESRFLSSIPAGDLPSIIINRDDQPSPNLSIGYRGQDFAWRTNPAWDGALPENWPRWLVFRDAPQNDSYIVLWARGDLFPGGILATTEEDVPILEEDFSFDGLPVE